MYTLWLVLAASVTLVICSDLVIYDISTQAKCTEETRSRSKNCIWPAGLNRFADQIVEGGRIVAYQIQWFNGNWSGWFVPGFNDLDIKFNVNARKCPVPYKEKTMRKMWSYFYDHNHKFIICKEE